VSSEPTVVVGRITRPHGVRGELAVMVLSEVPGRFDAGATVFLESGRALTIATSRPHKDRVLVTFSEVTDRESAEALRGAVLVVPESTSPPLAEGSWWDHQLVGCSVFTESGAELGELRQVIHTAANDVWSAVDGSDVETLIPVLRDVLISVDTDARRIVVREIPGLTVPDEQG
jgi:16S rRNA processing protein RimM